MATTPQFHSHTPLALASSSPSQFHQSSLQLQTRSRYHLRTHFLLRYQPQTHRLATPRFQAVLRTCKNCKTQFDPELNHPRACRFHTSHFGGETKRKFESVYKGGTMSTPDSGQVFQYWHCCGSEDPFDLGCTAAPHSSYDD